MGWEFFEGNLRSVRYLKRLLAGTSLVFQEIIENFVAVCRQAATVFVILE